ncbi:MAG TPA: SHOCT domain-containing protein [Eubacteriales bacterium]|nr:SHOCT domain-containing protein [Eubacteriales bacterium]
MSKKLVILLSLLIVYIAVSIITIFIPVIGANWTSEYSGGEVYHFTVSYSIVDIIANRAEKQINVKEEQFFKLYSDEDLTRAEKDEILGTIDYMEILEDADISYGNTILIIFNILFYTMLIFIIIGILFTVYKLLFASKFSIAWLATANVCQILFYTIVLFLNIFICQSLVQIMPEVTFATKLTPLIFVILHTLFIITFSIIKDAKINTDVIHINDNAKNDTSNKIMLLREYGNLLKEGLITEEDYSKKKTELLQ